jgi:hypothetical protein
MRALDRDRAVHGVGGAGHDPAAVCLGEAGVLGGGQRSSHRGKAAIDRLAARFGNAVMVHTPVHASWVNQVEVFFSVVQRKVVSPNDFTNLDDVKRRLADFEKRYNATARPFQWRFTRRDLYDLLARISEHERHDVLAELPHAA